MRDTYLSFYLRVSRIHVFVDALRGIGSPQRICFMVDPEGKHLLMLPHKKLDFLSHAVPQKVYGGTGGLEISSQKLCRILSGHHSWDSSRSYRVPGVIFEEKHLASFDLEKAEFISNDKGTAKKPI